MSRFKQYMSIIQEMDEIPNQKNNLEKLLKQDLELVLKKYVNEYRKEISNKNKDYKGDISPIGANKIIDDMFNNEELLATKIKEIGKSFKLNNEAAIIEEIKNFKESQTGKKWIGELKTKTHQNNQASTTPYKDWGKLNDSKDPKEVGNRIMKSK